MYSDGSRPQGRWPRVQVPQVQVTRCTPSAKRVRKRCWRARHFAYARDRRARVWSHSAFETDSAHTWSGRPPNCPPWAQVLTVRLHQVVTWQQCLPPLICIECWARDFVRHGSQPHALHLVHRPLLDSFPTFVIASQPLCEYPIATQNTLILSCLTSGEPSLTWQGLDRLVRSRSTNPSDLGPDRIVVVPSTSPFSSKRASSPCPFRVCFWFSSLIDFSNCLPIMSRSQLVHCVGLKQFVPRPNPTESYHH